MQTGMARPDSGLASASTVSVREGVRADSAEVLAWSSIIVCI